MGTMILSALFNRFTISSRLITSGCRRFATAAAAAREPPNPPAEESSDDKAPPKVHSARVLYAKAVLPELGRDNPEADFNQLIDMVHANWAGMKNKERKPYEKAHSHLLAEYRAYLSAAEAASLDNASSASSVVSSGPLHPFPYKQHLQRKKHAVMNRASDRKMRRRHSFSGGGYDNRRSGNFQYPSQPRQRRHSDGDEASIDSRDFLSYLERLP